MPRHLTPTTFEGSGHAGAHVLTESDRLVSASPAGIDAGWDGAPHPALLAAPDGTVHAANEAARLLFPALRPGRLLADCVSAWLCAAHAAGPAVAAGRVDDRTFDAHPVRQPEGPVMWWLVETTELHAAREALRRERERTAFLSAASDALLGSLNVPRTMEVAAELSAGHLADAAWIVAPGTRGRYSAVVCVRGARPCPLTLEIDPDELPGLAEALQGFPPVPSRWIDPAQAPTWIVPEGFGRVGSVVVTPLPGHGVPAGALILLRRTEHHAFTEDEEVFARLFAARSGAAMSAARLFEQQSSITEVLTEELLPPVLEQIGGVEFAGGYRPAQDTDRLGGDFYDVHPLGEGESLALLGDVCGKGLEAAVLTGKIRNTLHALLPMADDHGRMLRLLNSSLLSSHHTRFATLALVSACRHGQEVRLRVTSAGHLPPLVVRADGTVEEVVCRGSLIGVLPEIEVSGQDIVLAPGETCLLYTDGITEARGGPLGGEMFGEARLRRALGECAGMPAEAVVERVQMLASEWVGAGLHDDMALLAITAPRERHLTAVRGPGSP
ncbi:PP2C family protein-serine/threonine phosphatase [Amycolatopsis thermoflava]|uniref:Serine phosphatase RsbU (Regulator of sigma subunit) n=1 Tax=Amycolatopsis thermoflava TaxID=84480 RepID=A0A3N2GN10_9PSEU|nr:GAF domain-containing SpoIIE family protein phosphatase [Amycolatopsis thermoflava]ROS37972.1 serine phosphatase RsbU (regulator of sigma subunit) [Amycolatopsis thermoflava]